MKKLFISMALIFWFTALFAQPGESIYVVISGDTVHIWNAGANENCGCLFRMDAVLSNDSIYVTEVDTSSDWAYCVCTFDLCSSITGLQSGNYFVKVFRYMPLFYPDTVFYIGSTSFIYGGSSLAFNLNNYQSDCYNISEMQEDKILPIESKIEQNYPNPFNPITKIKWQVVVDGWQTIKVYDLLGREVTTLVNEYKPAGEYEVEFSAKGGSTSGGNAYNLPSGIYIYQLMATPSGGQASSFVETKKMILLK